MSDNLDLPGRPEDAAPMVLPARRQMADRRPPPPHSGSIGRVLLVLFLLFSLFVNVVLLLLLILPGIRTDGDDGMPIYEKHWSGNANANDKVAIVRVEGVLMDEMMGFDHRQIDKAAKDPHVKAVVLRVNSPGGTVTASDDLHKRLTELKNGNSPRYKSDPKKLVCSMGPIAASGGYYIAMPCDYIFAETTTTTGSIGVYASLPNVQKLANDNGVKMILVKAGDVKASGSMFQEMSPQERQQFQDMVDSMYGQFVKVVEAGRPKLKGMLTKSLFERSVPVYDEKGNKIAGKTVQYTRQRADGGAFTAADAKEYGLIDAVGYLEAATKQAAQDAGLTDYQVVYYDRPTSLLSILSGSGNERQLSFDPARLAAAATPRIWYMTPNCEFAGLFAAMSKP
jgi:protease-4